jgi:DNA-binding transcriptional LysR family regulator
MLLTDIRVFLEIVSTGSFTAAAQSLGAPKSSVARQLMRLEAEVGAQLIARTTRTVELTDEGRTFVPHARRLLDDSIEAQNVLRTHGESANGLLHVSAPSTFGRRFLAPHLPAFRSKHPNVRVALRLTSSKPEIRVGQTDIAVRLGPLVEPNLGVRPLGHIDYVLVASPAYLKGRPPLADPLDLASHDLLELNPPATDNRLDLYRNGELRSVRCVPAIEIDDPESVRAATLAGGGIATLPAFLAMNEIESGELTRVLDEWAPAPVPVHLVYGTKVAPPLRVRAYLDFLLETVGQNLPWQMTGSAA